MQCYQTKVLIFAVAIEKETSILSAINVQARKLHTVETFKPSTDWLHVFEELRGINAVNIMWSKSVNYSLLERLLSL